MVRHSPLQAVILSAAHLFPSHVCAVAVPGALIHFAWYFARLWAVRRLELVTSAVFVVW